MKTRFILFLAVVVAFIGCAAQKLPAFETTPGPPAEWNLSVEQNAGCPDTTGAYELIPKVVEIQEDNSWRASNGNWYDLILLISSTRVVSGERTPNETSSTVFGTSFLIDSDKDGHSLSISSPDKSGESYSTHVLSTGEDDYRCKAGSLIFPKFQIQGGTEGAFLNGKTYRQASMTSKGDLLFYEQVQSHRVVHRYYLFKSKQGSATSVGVTEGSMPVGWSVSAPDETNMCASIDGQYQTVGLGKFNEAESFEEMRLDVALGHTYPTGSIPGIVSLAIIEKSDQLNFRFGDPVNLGYSEPVSCSNGWYKFEQRLTDQYVGDGTKIDFLIRKIRLAKSDDGSLIVNLKLEGQYSTLAVLKSQDVSESWSRYSTSISHK